MALKSKLDNILTNSIILDGTDILDLIAAGGGEPVDLTEIESDIQSLNTRTDILSGYIENINDKTDLLTGTDLIYTIGNTGDFLTINEAFRWLSTQHYTGEDNIFFDLQTQTHTITAGINLYNFSGRLTFRGYSQTVEVAIPDGSEYYDVFNITGNGWIWITSMNFVEVANNYYLNLLYAATAGYVTFRYCTITGFYTISWLSNTPSYITEVSIESASSGGGPLFYLEDSSNLWMDSTDIDNLSNASGEFIYADSGSTIIIGSDVVIANFDTAIEAWNGASIYLTDIATTTFTNNTTDFSPEINTYGNFGAFITDNEKGPGTIIDSKLGSEPGSLVVLKNYVETAGSVSSTAGVLTLDLSRELTTFYITLTEDITSVVLSNVPSGVVSVTLEVTQHASAPKTITWGAGWQYHNSVAPEVTATVSVKDFFVIYTRNGGSTKIVAPSWYNVA